MHFSAILFNYIEQIQNDVPETPQTEVVVIEFRLYITCKKLFQGSENAQKHTKLSLVGYQKCQDAPVFIIIVFKMCLSRFFKFNYIIKLLKFN